MPTWPAGYRKVRSAAGELLEMSSNFPILCLHFNSETSCFCYLCETVLFIALNLKRKSIHGNNKQPRHQGSSCRPRLHCAVIGKTGTGPKSLIHTRPLVSPMLVGEDRDSGEPASQILHTDDTLTSQGVVKI